MMPDEFRARAAIALFTKYASDERMPSEDCARVAVQEAGILWDAYATEEQRYAEAAVAFVGRLMVPLTPIPSGKGRGQP